MWTGGGFGVGAGSGRRFQGPLKKVTLTMDGVFFEDGGFIGSNRRGLWEQIVLSAETHLRLAKIANQMHQAGDSAQKLLAEIETVTGPLTEFVPAPPMGERTEEMYRQEALERLARGIAMTRKMQDDERAVNMIMGWGEQFAPRFRRL